MTTWKTIQTFLSNISKKYRRLRLSQKIAFLCIVGCVILLIITTPPNSIQGTVKIYDRTNRLLFERAGSTGRHQSVPLTSFPQQLINAVIASEDEHFFTHPGIDIKAMTRSAMINITSGGIVSGASTITQQVARMNTGPSSSNTLFRYVNKIRESLIALRLTLTHSKNDVLSRYLNTVYLGNHNYGFQSAAQYYFHKNVDKLSLNESAYLAGMIASPSKYDPYTHKEEGEQRKAYVLERMAALGTITKEDITTLSQTPIELSSPNTAITAPHFVDYIMAKIESLHMPSSDISITTTLDSDTYLLSKRMSETWVETIREKNNVSNAAVVVLDNKTGAIISMLGGINYFSGHDGQVNIVTAPRQPGSAIKPITYLRALLQGFTPATLIYDVKTSYTTQKGEGFIPNNFGDKYHGLVLAREALASSYNLPAVEMLHRIGIPNFLHTARALGISTFSESKTYDYAITLGANEVSLLELSNVYASLARGGKYLEPYAIEKIVDGKGKTLYTHPHISPIERLGPEGEKASYLITDILSDPLARMPGFGEKNYLTLSRPAAVKTGTTTDWHDILTIGYTPSYTIGVWMGNTNNEAMRYISSATGSAPLWHQLFEEFLRDKPVEAFQKPEGLVQKEICAVSGDLYDGICPEKKLETFIKGTEPTQMSSIHKLIAIDIRNNLRASPDCGPNFVERKLLIEYPPQVYSWAVTNHASYIPIEYSPLCGKPEQIPHEEPLFIAITNPKNKAVFQTAPQLIRNQGISLEANTSSSVTEVWWYVDGKLFTKTLKRPFSVIFPLQLGEHVVYAQGKGNISSVDSASISFTVVGSRP